MTRLRKSRPSSRNKLKSTSNRRSIWCSNRSSSWRRYSSRSTPCSRSSSTSSRSYSRTSNHHLPRQVLRSRCRRQHMPKSSNSSCRYVSASDKGQSNKRSRWRSCRNRSRASRCSWRGSSSSWRAASAHLRLTPSDGFMANPSVIS